MMILVDGILVNYLLLGNKQASETLVFLHGWGRSLTDWQVIAKSFESEFKIILLDLPGFGASAKPKTDFDIYNYADLVEKFLAKIDINKCYLIGHSFGGRIGIILASQTNLINKLILISSGGIETKNFITKTKLLLINSLKPITKLLPEKFKSEFGSTDYKNAKEMRKIFIKVVNQDLTKLFKQIKTPTLVIWAENDKELPIKQAKIFKKLIPHSTLRIVWGAGHNSQIEKPDTIVELIKEFI